MYDFLSALAEVVFVLLAKGLRRFRRYLDRPTKKKTKARRKRLRG